MYDILEEMRNEVAEKVAKKVAHEKSVEFAVKLLSGKKLTNEEISRFSGLSLEEVEALAINQTA